MVLRTPAAARLSDVSLRTAVDVVMPAHNEGESIGAVMCTKRWMARTPTELVPGAVVAE